MSEENERKSCLGRSFQLGMLYDCFTDQLIPGTSLWGAEVIKQASLSNNEVSSGYEIINTNTVNEKGSSFGLDSELKLSLLAGLVNASGSTECICNFTTTSNTAYITIRHWTACRYEYLQMEKMQSMQYSKNSKIATHFVLAILHGFETALMFSCMIDDEDKKEDIKTIMTTVASAIAKNENLDKYKEKISKWNCKIYCDIPPNFTAASAKDAIEFYKNLPAYYSNKKPLQIRAQLFPLVKLFTKAPKVLQNVPLSYVDQIENILIALDHQHFEADKLIKRYTKVYSFLPELHSQICQHREVIKTFKCRFAEQLAIFLPHVRRGSIDHSEIQKMIENALSSPFNPETISNWLQSQNKMLMQLETLIQHCDCIPLVRTKAEFENLGLSTVFCFNISFIQQDTTQLDNMVRYLHFQENDTKSISEHNPWYQDEHFLSSLHLCIKNFKQYYVENHAEVGIGYIMLLNENIFNDNISIADQEKVEQNATMYIYQSGTVIGTLPPSTPSVPTVEKKTYDSISLQWSPPECGTQIILSYTVTYKREGELNWQQKVLDNDCTCAEMKGLTSDSLYLFKVTATFDTGTHITNTDSTRIRTIALPVAHRTKQNASLAKFVKNIPPAIYQIKMNQNMKNQNDMISWCSFGKKPAIASRKKVLIVVGATGAGKTTLINGMVNYLFKVDWNDDFRFKLVIDEGGHTQAKSQTTWITAYTFYKTEGLSIDYNLTIIDTPGFGDTAGLKRDKEITDQIRNMFSSKGAYAIDQLDGIGFVVQSSCARLTHTQRYIYDSILSIFGKDVSENIFVMTTFADGQLPPVLTAIKNADIPCLKYFKFNNSALFVNSSNTEVSEAANFDKMFWDMGYSSFELFFKSFERIQTKSLTMTRQVLTERQQLEVAVIGFQDQVKIGLSKLKQMQEEERILLKHKADVEANKNFTYEIDEEVPERITIQNEFVTNCLKCNYTCHYPCGIAHDEQKHGCAAMKGSGETAYCGVCPGGCGWRDHYNKNFRIITTKKTVTKTAKDLKNKYNVASAGKKAVENMVKNIEEALEYVHDEILKKVKITQQCLQRLDEIALKPNPLTEIQYIELLIRSEERDANDGYQDRVAFYKDALDQAKVMAGAQSFDVEESLKAKQKEGSKDSKGWLQRLTWWR